MPNCFLNGYSKISTFFCLTFCFLMPSISPASFLQRITLLSHSKGRGRKVWKVRKGSLESDCSNQSTFLSTQPISNSWVFHDPCTLVLFTPGVIGWNFFSSSKSVTQVSFDFYFPIICWNPFFFSLSFIHAASTWSKWLLELWLLHLHSIQQERGGHEEEGLTSL